MFDFNRCEMIQIGKLVLRLPFECVGPPLEFGADRAGAVATDGDREIRRLHILRNHFLIAAGAVRDDALPAGLCGVEPRVRPYAQGTASA